MPVKKRNSIATVTFLILAAAYGYEARQEDPGERFVTNRESPVTLTLPLEEDAFSFAVFGDRTGGPADGVKILAQAVDDVNAIGPDLVMTVGDLIEGYNTTEPWMKQMREFKGIMSELDCEWFPVAGNHDIYWRGDDRPASQHDENYEAHFGPLWYAFRHKSSWFIVLYTDEGNPETGEKNFNKPDCQNMSPEQFAWLEETLIRTKDAEHVFVFLHHPRWKGGKYGDDWQRVHKRLVQAGNVSAVFAGHIHAMTYDGVQDGIEYFTLATVGGWEESNVPEAGFLHQFDLVTVRKDGIDIASIPVGGVTDPRTITTETAHAAKRVYDKLAPRFKGKLRPCSDSPAREKVTVKLQNPVSRRVNVTLAVEGDPRRPAYPDHVHFVMRGGESLERSFEFVRGPDAVMDAAYRLPQLVISAEYMAEDARINIPARRFAFPASTIGLKAPAVSDVQHSLILDGDDASYAAVPSASLKLPDGAFTVEGWARFDEFKSRQGFLAKTESSDYGIFVGGGKATFFVHLDGRYASAEAEEASLPLAKWTHLAGVFDGEELRLYAGGKLVASKRASGKRKFNKFPLIIGGDVSNKGVGTSVMKGRVDEVRVSRIARYSGKSFRPERRFESDAETALLLHMDGASGPWLFDASSDAAHATLHGNASVGRE